MSLCHRVSNPRFSRIRGLFSSSAYSRDQGIDKARDKVDDPSPLRFAVAGEAYDKGSAVVLPLSPSPCHRVFPNPSPIAAPNPFDRACGEPVEPLMAGRTLLSIFPTNCPSENRLHIQPVKLRATLTQNPLLFIRGQLPYIIHYDPHDRAIGAGTGADGPV